jgi:hypothetical protein
MLRDPVRGAAATALMSVPMAVQWLAQPGVPPPPMVIAERLQRRFGLKPEARNPVLRHAAWLSAHFGFGVTLAVASRLWPRRSKTEPAAQPYGAAVWAANYGLLMPALGLYPWVWRDRRGRAVETFASHLVYAAALGRFAAPRGRRR